MTTLIDKKIRSVLTDDLINMFLELTYNDIKLMMELFEVVDDDIIMDDIFDIFNNGSLLNLIYGNDNIYKKAPKSKKINLFYRLFNSYITLFENLRNTKLKREVLIEEYHNFIQNNKGPELNQTPETINNRNKYTERLTNNIYHNIQTRKKYQNIWNFLSTLPLSYHIHAISNIDTGLVLEPFSNNFLFSSL